MSHQFQYHTVGQIVADNFAAAHVFHRFRIDFCCHGSTPFSQACAEAGVDQDEVVRALEHVQTEIATAPDFGRWPMDLLIDYVLKIHHRGIRQRTPELSALMAKVARVHGEAHPELYEVQQLLEAAFIDLEDHLQKEEQVLFPFLYHQYDSLLEGRRPEGFHCGSVAMPIEVMMGEHEQEGSRFRRIALLTNEFTAPEGACGSYRLLLDSIRQFELDLHEHIHIENNIIFPEALRLEQSLA